MPRLIVTLSRFASSVVGLPQNPALQILDSILARLARLSFSRNHFNHANQTHKCVERIVALGESVLDQAMQSGFQSEVERRRPFCQVTPDRSANFLFALASQGFC